MSRMRYEMGADIPSFDRISAIADKPQKTPKKPKPSSPAPVAKPIPKEKVNA